VCQTGQLPDPTWRGLVLDAVLALAFVATAANDALSVETALPA